MKKERDDNDDDDDGDDNGRPYDSGKYDLGTASVVQSQFLDDRSRLCTLSRRKKDGDHDDSGDDDGVDDDEGDDD